MDLITCLECSKLLSKNGNRSYVRLGSRTKDTEIVFNNNYFKKVHNSSVLELEWIHDTIRGCYNTIKNIEIWIEVGEKHLEYWIINSWRADLPVRFILFKVTNNIVVKI